MSSWGLTDEQRQCRPWGIEPQLLAPQKTITDPIHGEVFVTELERRIIDTRSFQRLRRIRQLGTAHLVYPAATNSRFSHALGALRAAQDILNVVLDQRNTKGHVPDIFDQWNHEARGDKNVYNERVGRAVVLCRLGALLHDIGHVPFGHTLEDDLRLLVPHDENEERFTYYWNEILKTAKIELDEELVKYLKVLVLSGTGSADALPRDLRFVKDPIGNTICADLLDYLPRDHYFSGLPAQLGSASLTARTCEKPTSASIGRASRCACSGTTAIASTLSLSFTSISNTATSSTSGYSITMQRLPPTSCWANWYPHGTVHWQTR
ncbi:MAG: HD domain-containing protein [Planctomycetota bacterium]|nr:HD domain-containing protein [Planctomycetota bacterium]